MLITMGDVAGIGPEIISKGWAELVNIGRPVVVGDAAWLRRALRAMDSPAEVREIAQPREAQPSATVIPCLRITTVDVSAVVPGRVAAAAGRAAHDFLVAAIDLAMAGEADAVVTCPLHKEGLRAAGLPYPGHTEILAERTGASRHAMLLYGDGLAVLHVTLHVALRDAVMQITTQGVRDAIELLDGLLPALIGRRPRLGVCALNPHASDGGLFGDEEERIIRPAVETCRAAGIDVTGPTPADALWAQAAKGAYDGIIAQYHDQGHIPMKMRSGRQAVNITAGLPIVRTSVAHGTAYDIAGRGIADPSSLVEAARVAARMAEARTN